MINKNLSPNQTKDHSPISSVTEKLRLLKRRLVSVYLGYVME